MSATLKDLFLVFVIGLALLAEVALLSHELKLVALPHLPEAAGVEGPIVAQLVARQNQVQALRAQRLSWLPVTDGETIPAGTTIMTSADSWGRFVTPEGLEIETAANTHFSLSTDHTVDLARGTLRIKATAPAYLRVSEKELTLAQGTELSLSHAVGHSQDRLFIKKGSAQLVEQVLTRDPAAAENPTERVISLNAGDLVRFDALNDTVKFESTLKIEPVFPKSMSRLMLSQSPLTIRFQWLGDEAETLEIDETTEFLQPRIYRIKGKEALLDLEAGNFFWRLAKGSKVSSSFTLVNLPMVRYILRTPASGMAIKRNTPIALTWDAVDDMEGYRVQLSRKVDFTTLEWERETEAPSLTIDSLSVGKYYWRVKAKNARLGEWPPSSTREFTVKK